MVKINLITSKSNLLLLLFATYLFTSVLPFFSIGVFLFYIYSIDLHMIQLLFIHCVNLVSLISHGQTWIFQWQIESRTEVIYKILKNKKKKTSIYSQIWITDKVIYLDYHPFQGKHTLFVFLHCTYTRTFNYSKQWLKNKTLDMINVVNDWMNSITRVVYYILKRIYIEYGITKNRMKKRKRRTENWNSKKKSLQQSLKKENNWKHYFFFL